MSVSIVIPTYNEASNIDDLVTGIRSVMEGREYEIVVVDGGSSDGTAETVESLAEQFDNIRPVLKGERDGLGSALRDGFHAADGDIVVQMDADFSHPPEQIPDLVDAVGDGADVAVGSRYVDGGDRQDPVHRRIFPLIGSYLYRVLLRSPVRDVTSGFKAYSRDAAEVVAGEDLPDGFHFQAASLFTLIDAGYSVEEVPITFRPRRSGDPKYAVTDLVDNVALLGKLAVREHSSFFKFGFVGGLGVGVNMAILYTLTDIAGLYYLFSAVGAAEGAILFNFVFHDSWTFPDAGGDGLWQRLRRLYQYHVVSAAGGAVNVAVLWFLTDIIGIYYLVSNLLAITVAFFVNYGVNVRWTWAGA